MVGAFEALDPDAEALDAGVDGAAAAFDPEPDPVAAGAFDPEAEADATGLAVWGPLTATGPFTAFVGVGPFTGFVTLGVAGIDADTLRAGALGTGAEGLAGEFAALTLKG